MKCFIIGIGGGSAGGKSIFAQDLKNRFGDNCHVFSMDAYFLPPEQRRVVNAPVTEKPYRDDNHPSSFDLDSLKTDLKTASESGEYKIIIVEGLLTLWDEELYKTSDLKLFVDCRPDERIVRRLKRNMGWGLTFDEISSVYLDMVRYRHDEYVEPTKWRADIIINGSNPSEITTAMIVEYVKSKIN